MSTLYKVQKQAKLIYHVRSQSSGVLGRGSSTWKDRLGAPRVLQYSNLWSEFWLSMYSVCQNSQNCTLITSIFLDLSFLPEHLKNNIHCFLTVLCILTCKKRRGSDVPSFQEPQNLSQPYKSNINTKILHPYYSSQ